MDLGIKKMIDSGNGDTLIYTGLLAATLANCIPTAADGIYFSLQQKWNQQKADGIITPKQYWTYDTLGYYGITAGYYGIAFLTMLSLGKTSFSTKSKILLSLIGGGIVVGVAMKNIQKDNKIIWMKNINTSLKAA